MEIKAISKQIRISPRKVREIANMAKKIPLIQIQDRLGLTARSGAKVILATIKSAIANAQVKQLKTEDLKIKNILVDEGVRMKRRDKSHGARFGGGLIHKRTSHITVILEG